METLLIITKPLVQATYIDYTGTLEGDGTFHVMPGNYPAKLIGDDVFIITSKGQGFKPFDLRSIVGHSAIAHAAECDGRYNSGDDINQSNTEKAWQELPKDSTPAALLKWHIETIRNFHCN